MGFFDSVNNVGVGGDYDLPSTRYRATSTMTVGESREGHSALMLLRGRHHAWPWRTAAYRTGGLLCKAPGALSHPSPSAMMKGTRIFHIMTNIISNHP